MKIWLTEIFPKGVEVRVSTDIEKGAIWRNELETFLSNSRAGLLCITPEALESPWVNFEAGFLARSISAGQLAAARPAGQLFTFLLGATASDLKGPLADFQSTDASDERDTERLVKALLSLISLEESAREALIKDWNVLWPKHWASLRGGLAVIPKATLREVCPRFPELFRRKTFEEPSDECMSQEWLARYCGARETLSALKAAEPKIQQACRRYVRELLHALVSEVDAYSNALSQLIGERYSVADSGKLKIEPAGLATTCEKRRRAVRRLVARIEDPPPFFDDAVQFDAAETLQEANNLMHRIKPVVRSFAKLTGGKPLDAVWPEEAACFWIVFDSKKSKKQPRVKDPHHIDLDLHWRTSRWAFDRVMYGVYLRTAFQHVAESSEDCEALAIRTLDFADEQFDIARAQLFDAGHESDPSTRALGTNLMPLTCALASVEVAGHYTCEGANAKRVWDLAHAVLGLLSPKPHHEPARSIAGRLRERTECAPDVPRPKPALLEREAVRARAYAAVAVTHVARILNK